MKVLVSFLLFFVCVALSFTQEKPDTALIYQMGRDLEARGHTEESNRYYNDAVRICLEEINANTASMDTYAVLTLTLRRQNKYNEVIRYGQQALRIREDLRIVETMGEAYFYLNDFDASLRNMQRYTAVYPQGDRASIAYFFIGEIFRFQKKYHYADIAYTTAVQLEGGMALWWFRLGTVREAARDFTPAVEAYERALKINPAYNEAAEGLARSRKAAV